jgi:hypothetical protein
MKTRLNISNYSATLKTALLALLLLPWIVANADDFKKTYQQKYDVDKGAVLVIDNKFGDLHCQAWDESSVSIIVTVTVDAYSQEKADRVFDKIKVDLTGSRTKVQGITTADNISNANFSIDYEIKLPRWINIDLDNKFGDIYLDENQGEAKINLEYGAIEVNDLSGPKNDLTIKFSDGEAGFIKQGDLHIEYSEWESKGADNFKVYSRFSELTIEKVALLNLDSQYDEVKVGSAGQVISVSRFSELDFDKINGDFDFDAEYGDISVSYISPAFKVGKVRNSFAEADLTFDPKASMTVTAESEFGELSYPHSNSAMNDETIGFTTHKYNGRIGANPVSQLTIISKNCDTSIDFAD